MMRCEDCKAYSPAEKVIEGQLHTMRYGTCKWTGLCHEARDKACKKRFQPLMPGDFAVPKKHVCPICGTEFTAEPPSKKYCSEECKTRANRESSQRQYLRKKSKSGYRGCPADAPTMREDSVDARAVIWTSRGRGII